MLCTKIYAWIKKIICNFISNQVISNEPTLSKFWKKYRVSRDLRHFWFDRFSRNSILKRKYVLSIKFFFFAYRFLKIFRIRRYIAQCTFIDICRFTTISKSLSFQKFWHKMAYFDQIMLCTKIYAWIKKNYLQFYSKSSYLKWTNFVQILKKKKYGFKVLSTFFIWPVQPEEYPKGCRSVILLRSKMRVAPHKHDVISMPTQQCTNTKHISKERYHPVVSIMLRYLDTELQF